MRSLALVSAAVVIGVTGCGDGGGGRLSESFCNDLEAGYSPFQILLESVRDGTYTPQEAADRAYGFAAISCPEQLKTNEKLRIYLQNWNINPDV